MVVLKISWTHSASSETRRPLRQSRRRQAGSYSSRTSRRLRGQPRKGPARRLRGQDQVHPVQRPAHALL